MSADKRSVHTDALETLGTIITENEKRDAIHLAVENCVAAHRLMAGEDVGLLDDGTAGRCRNPVGIVDPFLKDLVQPGQHFWLVLYPRQITSLHHVWTHPAFDDAPKQNALSPSVEAAPVSKSPREIANELPQAVKDIVVNEFKEDVGYEDSYDDGCLGCYS